MRNKRERQVLPVKPVSRYQAKQLKGSESRALGSALLAALRAQAPISNL